jgi:hypothetical protein
MAMERFQKKALAARANEKKRIKEWSDAHFGVKPKCKRCGVEVNFGEQRVSIDDFGWTLCRKCIELGISLGKLDDPMKDNPLAHW